MNTTTFDDQIMIEASIDDPDFERILTLNTASQDWIDGAMDSQLYMDVIDAMGFSPEMQLDRIQQVLRREQRISAQYGFNS